MLRHNWKCMLQNDFVYTYLFIVMFSYYLFYKCEAESLKTNSLTRLWKMSESGNRLLDISTAINKTHTQNSKSTVRSNNNDFIPSFSGETIRSFDETQTILPLFSELSSTYRTPGNTKNGKVHPFSISPSTLKSYKNNNEGTLESVIKHNYTTIKPYKSSSNFYDINIFNGSKIRTPTTYKPSVPLNFWKNKKILTNDDYYEKSSNYSESDSIARSNPVTQVFRPRKIPLNEYSITEEPAITVMFDPFTTTFKEQLSMKNIPEESSSKTNSKIRHHYYNDEYNATERTLIPSVTMTSYRDPGFTVTGRQLNEELTHYNHSMTKPVQDIDKKLSKDIDGARKSSIKKKYKKFMLPLLLAYKLKFFALFPILMGGLVLLAGSTGMAGFFFALFAAVMGLKTNGGHN